MKKVVLFFLSFFFLGIAFAQNRDYKKGHNLGISFFLNDFKSAADIRQNGIVNTIKEKKFFKLSQMNPGLAVNYLAGLSNHVDFIGTLGGSLLDYPSSNFTSPGSDKLLLEATGSVNLKLLTDRYAVVPFLDLGAGASQYDGHFGAFLPVGVGLQLNIADAAFLLLNSQYRVAVTENASYHFYHSIGIAGTIGKAKVVEPKAVPIPVVTDRDHDGILDSLDACPDEAGLEALQGCPDKDGDGIADKDDKCPDVSGLAKYQGCPIPDTDKDGINDEEDKCPNVPGVARYDGCPVPDTDGDGVNDEEDKCPKEVGPASNFGCPVIDVVVVEKVNKAAENIFFATGSSRLLAKSFKSLKEVAQILKDNPSYNIDVDGHTDNTGSDELNQKLSENRANAVKQYLIGNNISAERIVATGFGERKPIADNNTAVGRSKNRRVEMRLRNY
jgi:outer membrane protein OmpA-like peptidoglycan-associated protein